MRFGEWRRLLPAVVLLAGLLWSANLPGQEKTAPPNRGPAPDGGPATSDDDAWEKLIYVPYKNLKSVLDKHGATVFLPYLDYLKLWERSGAASPTSDKPPVSAVLSESHYVARIEKDLARVEVTLVVRALGKAWSQVPLRFGEAAIGKLTAADERVVLRGTGKGTYTLLLPAPGRHEVKLELLARVRTSPEGRSLELECPPVGITTLELSIPDADQSVETVPRLVALPVEEEAGRTRIKANLGSTDKITANWHPRVGLKPEMELLTAVSNALSVSIDERIIHADATLTYQVLRGELSQIRLAVPVGHRILDISAGEVRLKGWKTTAEANRQVVTVDLLSPVRGSVAIDVHTEGPLPAESFDLAGISDQGVVHGIHAIDVVRESGVLVVSSVRGMTLNVDQQQGVTRIDAAEIGESRRKPDGLYYRFYGPAFQLRGTARPVEPRLLVDQTARLIFGDDELRLSSEFVFEIERAGIFELSLKVPENLTIDSVTAAAMKGYQVDAATRTLKVSFQEKTEGRISLAVNGHRDLQNGGAGEHVLPLLEPIGVVRDTGRLFVFGPEGVELITDQDKVIGAHPETESSIAEPGETRLVSAWSYSRRPVEIPVRVVRKPTRLTAKVATTITIAEDLADVVSLIDFQVEHAGLDTFRLAVPEAVADKVRISSVGDGALAAIKQQSRDEEAVDGWVTWTVVMQQKGVGTRRLRVSYDLKPARPEQQEQNSAGGVIDFQPPRALGLTNAQGEETVPLAQVEGELAVAKDRALSVSAEAAQTDLEAIDVRELKLIDAGAANLAYRYFKQPVGLKITAVKHDIQGVVETVVSKALVEVVVGRDPVTPLATYRCRYQVRTSERQRLRLDLPQGTEPLAVLVGGRPITLEKDEAASPEAGWSSYFVNVARSQGSDAPFLLTLQLQRPISPAPFQAYGGRLQLSLPRIGGKNADGVAVQHLRVVAWVPEKYALVGTPENFLCETRSRLSGLGLGLLETTNDLSQVQSWIGAGQEGLIDFPTEGHAYQFSRLGRADVLEVTWWHMPFRATVISIAVLLVALALIKTTWEHRLGLVLIAGLLLCLYALSDADAALHLLAAARYGVAAMFVVWILHGVLGSRADAQRALAAPAGSPSPSPPAAAAPSSDEPKTESPDSSSSESENRDG